MKLRQHPSNGSPGISLEFGTVADDAELRGLLRETPMGGPIRLSLRREPGFFRALAVEGPFQQVIVAREQARRRLVGMGTRSIRDRYVERVATPVGYLSGLRIGFESDSQYLGCWRHWGASRLLVAPAAIARLRSIDNARYATLCYLLACENLALISIWSPLFLTTLLPAVRSWCESICDDLAEGTIRLPRPEEEQAATPLPFQPNSRRAARLRAAEGRRGSISNTRS
jgi:hypothetical protein